MDLDDILIEEEDRDPLPNQTFQNTIYSEQISFQRRLSHLVQYHHGKPVHQIAKTSRCSILSVLESFGTWKLINQFFLDSIPSSPIPTRSVRRRRRRKMMKQKSKIRRTHYVELNKMVWNHFKECQAAGIVINGKHLKDHAMSYAKQMRLETFRGSEGWLDAFKRRHRIDLKTMTGYPVCYENEMQEDVDKECEELDAQNIHQNQQAYFDNNVSAEFASTFLPNLNGFHHQHMLAPPQPEPTTSNPLQNMINNLMTNSHHQLFMDTSRVMQNGNGNNQPATCSDQEQNGIPHDSNLMRSCTIKVNDKEISHALDTIRTHIMRHDPEAMNLLLPLQERLALSTRVDESTVSSSTTA